MAIPYKAGSAHLGQTKLHKGSILFYGDPELLFNSNQTRLFHSWLINTCTKLFFLSLGQLKVKTPFQNEPLLKNSLLSLCL